MDHFLDVLTSIFKVGLPTGLLVYQICIGTLTLGTAIFVFLFAWYNFKYLKWKWKKDREERGE